MVRGGNIQVISPNEVAVAGQDLFCVFKVVVAVWFPFPWVADVRGRSRDSDAYDQSRRRRLIADEIPSQLLLIGIDWLIFGGIYVCKVLQGPSEVCGVSLISPPHCLSACPAWILGVLYCVLYYPILRRRSSPILANIVQIGQCPTLKWPVHQ